MMIENDSSDKAFIVARKLDHNFTLIHDECRRGRRSEIAASIRIAPV
jgi:hypothetical protein